MRRSLSMKRNNSNSTGKGLARISLITLIAVYVLILVGGIVRSTGSGMGCPDWPKCFGSWVPPTSADELPDNYQEIYAAKRMEKNEKFVDYLQVFGFSDLGDEILNDESINEETPFNIYRTWTEYINRLVGATIGLLMILTVIAARPFTKRVRHLFYLAFIALLLTIFQGWLGSIVVSTNLLPWMVTVHMIPALIIVAMLIYIVQKSRNLNLDLYVSKSDKILNSVIVVCIVLLLTQIILGTQVREAIDSIASSLGESNRGEWVSNLGVQFIVHRSFSWAIVISHTLLVYWLIKKYKATVTDKFTVAMIGVVLVNVLTGIIMAYLGMPAFAQPLHLLLAIILFGMQVLLFFKVNMKNNEIEVG